MDYVNYSDGGIGGFSFYKKNNTDTYPHKLVDIYSDGSIGVGNGSYTLPASVPADGQVLQANTDRSLTWRYPNQNTQYISNDDNPSTTYFDCSYNYMGDYCAIQSSSFQGGSQSISLGTQMSPSSYQTIASYSINKRHYISLYYNPTVSFYLYGDVAAVANSGTNIVQASAQLNYVDYQILVNDSVVKSFRQTYGNIYSFYVSSSLTAPSVPYNVNTHLFNLQQFLVFQGFVNPCTITIQAKSNYTYTNFTTVSNTAGTYRMNISAFSGFVFNSTSPNSSTFSKILGQENGSGITSGALSCNNVYANGIRSDRINCNTLSVDGSMYIADLSNNVINANTINYSTLNVNGGLGMMTRYGNQSYNLNTQNGGNSLTLQLENGYYLFYVNDNERDDGTFQNIFEVVVIGNSFTSVARTIYGSSYVITGLSNKRLSISIGGGSTGPTVFNVYFMKYF